MTTSWGEAGQLVTTRGVHELMASDGRFFEAVMAALRHYCQGDWGECCADDAALNDEAHTLRGADGRWRHTQPPVIKSGSLLRLTGA